jgi:hypothetical protein
LASSTSKKVVVRRFQREALTGYANPVSFQQPQGIELLSPEGNVASVPYAEIKCIDFVRDFESAGGEERRTFNTRPKMEGLWVSVRFRDDAVLEGVMPNNLLQIEPYGFMLIPPDPYSNTQRVFVPRQAALAVQVLGVVGSPLARRKPKPAPKEQIGLFDQ